MSNRSVLKVLVILALVFGVAFGAQLFGLARANPFFGIPIVDPVPGTTPSGIEIISPQNGTTYSSDVVSLNFNVSKPELVTAFKTGITRVVYLLDNQPTTLPTEVYSIYTANDNAPGRQNVTFTTNLNLPTGNHKLTIHAEGIVYTLMAVYLA